MAVMKSEQILTESRDSFEDAIRVGVKRFARTVRGLRSANVNNLQAVIEGDRVVTWRVNMQVTFQVENAGGGKGKKKKKR